MAQALYGDGGFYTAGAGPAAHFRTAVHASALFAGAVSELAASRDLDTVVDVGAGGGELLTALHRLDPARRLVAVELAPRPAGLPRAIEWYASTAGLPAGIDALLVANEWLDNVPFDLAECGPDGVLRYLEVETSTGDERLGGPLDDEDAAWLAQWWALPPDRPGRRAEIGRPRDLAWAGAVAALRSGVAVAIDYAHERAERPQRATLTAYRSGRVVRAVPDGSCDLTAHVALDACAAAGEDAGSGTTVLVEQALVLRQLGVSAARPPLGLATTDPGAYVAALTRAGEAAELLDPEGLGGFTWLIQEIP